MAPEGGEARCTLREAMGRAQRQAVGEGGGVAMPWMHRVDEAANRDGAERLGPIDDVAA